MQKVDKAKIEKIIQELQCNLDLDADTILNKIAILKFLLEQIEADLKASKNQ